jgi:small subunit ribosomal protein S5
VIAGGAVRSVLEVAGVKNVLAKRLGGRSALNNARATIKALGSLRTMEDYAEGRGIPVEYMLS